MIPQQVRERLDPNLVAARMRHLRIQAKMSQREFAEASGINHPTYISDYELGKRIIPAYYFKPIAEALNTSISDLLLWARRFRAANELEAQLKSHRESSFSKECVAQLRTELKEAREHVNLLIRKLAQT